MAIRKYLLIWGFTLLSFLAGALILVGRAQAETIGFTLADTTGATSDVQVTVLDDQTQAPIQGASVLIGDTLEASLAAQPLQTSATGLVTFSRSAATPKALTVSKAGYATLSLVGVQSTKVTVFLKTLPQANPDVIASGTLGGFPDSVPDGAVEAGFVLRSMSAFDLLHFQVDSFISPIKDTIDVMGPRDIPSNIVLPDQSIFVSFLPVELNKPTYRLPVTANRSTRLAGLEGQAMVDDLLPSFQSDSGITIDLLNKVKFTKVGLTQPITPTADFRQDFNAILKLGVKHQVTVSRPPFSADVLVAAATDFAGDRQTLMPTDVKVALSADSRSNPRPVNLVAPLQSLGQARDVITIAVGQKGKILSGIVTDQAGKTVQPGEFLPATALDDVTELPAEISLQASAQGVAAVVFEAADDAQSTHPVWMIYALPSAGGVRIPTAQMQGVASLHGYSSSQFEFGAGFDEKNVDGHTVMRKLTRFTRVSADISP